MTSMLSFLRVAIPALLLSACYESTKAPSDGEITFELPDAGVVYAPCEDAGEAQCLIDRPCYCRFTEAESGSGYTGLVAQCYTCESVCASHGDGCFLYPQTTP